jgi:hypothetical protein
MAGEPIHSHGRKYQVDFEWSRRNLRGVVALECIWTLSLSAANPRWVKKQHTGFKTRQRETNSGLTVDAPKVANDRRRNRCSGGNTMKPIGIISTSALFLLFGVAAPVDARQEKPEKQEEKAKPAKQEQQAKPQHQQEAKAPKQEQQAKPEKQQRANAPKQEQSAKPEKQQQAKAPKQEQQAKPEHQQQAKAPKQQQQQQTRSSQPPQRTQQAVARQRAQPALRLSVRGSGRIPDARFHSNFGRDHYFRIGTPVMVSGYSRFQYGGFWFGFVEPWPSGWYYTDDVYIDYVDDGYYMYNPYYPGTRFAISVVI